MNSTVLIGSILSIFIGLALCFFGERIFKISLSATGFGIGALLLAGLSYSVTNNPLLALGAGFVGGLISYFIVHSFYRTGMFFIGFALSALVITYVLIAAQAVSINIQDISQVDANMIQQFLPMLGIGFVAASISGALFVIFDTPILKFATAIAGAMLVCISGFVLTTGTDSLPQSTAQLVSAPLFIFGLAWIPLALAGLVFQFFGIDWLLRFLQIDAASRHEKARREAYRQQQQLQSTQMPPQYPQQPPATGYPPQQPPNPQPGGYSPQQPPNPQQGGYPPQQPPAQRGGFPPQARPRNQPPRKKQ